MPDFQQIQEQRWPAMTTLIITLIIITPLCGFLFQCGCDWPWAGLDANCNFYNPHAIHRCPWCASMFTGILSTGIAIIAGVWASMTSLDLFTDQRPSAEIVMRIVFGTLIFVLMATLIAGFSALYQSYPLGIGSFLKI